MARENAPFQLKKKQNMLFQLKRTKRDNLGFEQSPGVCVTVYQSAIFIGSFSFNGNGWSTFGEGVGTVRLFLSSRKLLLNKKEDKFENKIKN